MQDNIAAVNDIYAAFGCGDIAAILDRLAPDVAWEAWADNSAQRAGVPWMQPQRGRAGAAAFFEQIARFAIHEFKVLSVMGGGNQVASECVIDATLPNGVRYRDEEMHLWTFGAGGKVTRFRHYLDTAKHIEAMRTR